jgi:HD-like signal output (HDOD) protein/GGDEF domain-containing protein
MTTSPPDSANSTGSASSLERFVARAGQLYSLPAVAIEVLELTSNPQLDSRALKECIENDPALTTKILRVVNSSLFGLSRAVSDLNQALALLGTKPLKLLVLGFSLPNELLGGVSPKVLNRYWRRTLTKAVTARELHRKLWRGEGDEAFIAGLLDDVGVLVLVKELGDTYSRFLEKVQAEHGDLPALEQASLGFTHAELSARLLDGWNLPEPIVQAVAGGATGAAVTPEAQRLIDVLQLAELIAGVLIDERPDALPELLERGAAFGFSSDELNQLVETLEEKVRQLAEVLSLSPPQGVHYRDVLVTAYARLAEAAEAAVPDAVRVERMRRTPLEVPQLPSMTPPQPHHDPTTGDADSPDFDPGFEGQVANAVAACRQYRQPLSLFLVEMDHPTQLLFRHGPKLARSFAELVRNMCQAVDRPGAECFATREAQCAVVLSGFDRDEAVDLAGDLVKGARRLGASKGAVVGPITVSVGVASMSVPPKNFPAQELIKRADRCLYGAKSAGGNGLKSIEIC